MFSFSTVLSHLQAAIAVRAARDRAWTVLLVALWGKIGRVATRLERLVALWRAGKLPPARAPRGAALPGGAGRPAGKVRFPRSAGWLRRRLGYEVGICGAGLANLLTQAECAEFLAACPQARRLLRPLLRMLTFDPLPEAVRPLTRPMAAEVLDRVGVTSAPAMQIFPG
jgi:hypothetical protein